MILTNFITRALCRALWRRAGAVVVARDPDFLIGPEGDPYMLRWWVIPRNRVFNIYLHSYRHDDDDRALHDHPWLSVSFALAGRMHEIYRRPDGSEAGRDIEAGAVVFRSARFAHRLVIPDGYAMTLFCTGPIIRKWGFWCPKGWRPWREFVDDRATGRIGRGCE